MKLIRFLDSDGRVRHGAVQHDVDTHSPPDSALLIEGTPPHSYHVTDRTARVKKLLYPIEPPMVLGIGANYKEIFTSSGRPLPEYPIVFYKLKNSLQHPGEPIVLPRRTIRSDKVKYEGELCVVLGKEAKNVSSSDAMKYVFGYTIANDVSGVDWQGERVGMQWSKGKSFDTFCPFGPAIATADEVADASVLRIVTRVNGTTEQDESVSEMCFNVAELIEFLSAGYTLPPGSIILTGTPPGARFVEAGERVDITVNGIGTLSNPVRDEE